VWIVERHPLRDEGASRHTDEGGFFDADRIHERIDVGGEVVEGVAAFGLIRVPMSALGEREASGPTGPHPLRPGPKRSKAGNQSPVKAALSLTVIAFSRITPLLPKDQSTYSNLIRTFWPFLKPKGLAIPLHVCNSPASKM
jgi:hypothetical protein